VCAAEIQVAVHTLQTAERPHMLMCAVRDHASQYRARKWLVVLYEDNSQRSHPVGGCGQQRR
jgi:hypothetical protein